MPLDQEGHQSPSATTERFGDQTRALENYAATSRTDAAAWLSLMAEHVRNGDITPEGLQQIVGMIGTQRASVLFKKLESEFPNATNVFTYLRINALYSLFGNEPRLAWPARYPLDGVSLDGLGVTPYFRGGDLSQARIAFGIDRKGKRVSLDEDALTVPKHDIWKRSTQVFDTCAHAELYFQTALAGKSLHKRLTPFMGVIFTDQGKPVACMKFDGVDSILALRTVEQEDGTHDLTRGIIYAFSNMTHGFIMDLVAEQENQDKASGRVTAFENHVWFATDIRQLAARAKAEGYALEKNPMRFIANESEQRDRGEIYPLIHAFVEKVEGGELSTRPLLETVT